jgi:hypothetical protein
VIAVNELARLAAASCQIFDRPEQHPDASLAPHRQEQTGVARVRVACGPGRAGKECRGLGFDRRARLCGQEFERGLRGDLVDELACEIDAIVLAELRPDGVEPEALQLFEDVDQQQAFGATTKASCRPRMACCSRLV